MGAKVTRRSGGVFHGRVGANYDEKTDKTKAMDEWARDLDRYSRKVGQGSPAGKKAKKSATRIRAHRKACQRAKSTDAMRTAYKRGRSIYDAGK